MLIAVSRNLFSSVLRSPARGGANSCSTHAVTPPSLAGGVKLGMRVQKKPVRSGSFAGSTFLFVALKKNILNLVRRKGVKPGLQRDRLRRDLTLPLEYRHDGYGFSAIHTIRAMPRLTRYGYRHFVCELCLIYRNIRNMTSAMKLCIVSDS